MNAKSKKYERKKKKKKKKKKEREREREREYIMQPYPKVYHMFMKHTFTLIHN